MCTFVLVKFLLFFFFGALLFKVVNRQHTDFLSAVEVIHHLRQSPITHAKAYFMTRSFAHCKECTGAYCAGLNHVPVHTRISILGSRNDLFCLWRMQPIPPRASPPLKGNSRVR